MRNAIIASTAILAGAASAAWAEGMDSLTAPTGTDSFQLAQTQTYDRSLYGVSNSVSGAGGEPATDQSANLDDEEETAQSGQTAANDVDEPASTGPAPMDEDPVLPASPEDEPNADETASADEEGEGSESFLGSLYESLFGSDEGESATR